MIDAARIKEATEALHDVTGTDGELGGPSQAKIGAEVAGIDFDDLNQCGRESIPGYLELAKRAIDQVDREGEGMLSEEDLTMILVFVATNAWSSGVMIGALAKQIDLAEVGS